MLSKKPFCLLCNPLILISCLQSVPSPTRQSGSPFACTTSLPWILAMVGSEQLQHQAFSFVLRCFLLKSHDEELNGVSSWILSPSSFKNTVGLSYISQSCAVVGSTSVCNLKKKIQDSFCLTFPSVASSELLLILLACCRSGSVSKTLPHTQQTLLLFSTAAPTTGQKVELSGSGLCFLNVQKTTNGGIVWIYGNHWQLKK